MKQIVVFVGIMLCFTMVGLSQCSVNTFIEDNYELDAKLLALREILSDPSDPDYDNPFLPQARVIPYLEKLSAIYENPNNEPIIDSLFNEFQIHANSAYNFGTEYRGLNFSVDTNVSWVQTLKDTGMSGFPPLDNFFATYQLTVTDYIDLVITGVTHFTMTTGFDFLNIFAILDDLDAIEDINGAWDTIAANDLNYTGILYFLNGNEPVEVCDIIVDNDVYTFCLYAGDCLTGCLYSRCWTVEVAEDCSTVVLDTQETGLERFAVYPNPASDKIHIHGVTSEIETTLIYSVTGNLVYSEVSNSETIDISNLNSGIYFLEIITSEGNKQVQKFIKE
jgi:hypothetical protein